MASLRRALVLAIPLMILACRSAPMLPPGEVPPDFVFSYEMTREAAPPAAPVARPDGTVPTGPAPVPSTAALSHVRVEVQAAGDVEYEVRYGAPAPARNEGTLRIDPAKVRAIYDRVRAANLEAMPPLHVGEDPSLGKETYHVMGAGRQMLWIDVEGMRVEALTSLWNDVMELLPARQMLLPPKPVASGFVLDRGSGKFHRVSCPQLAGVDPASKQDLQFPEAGLNAGGFPCEECKPLQK